MSKIFLLFTVTAFVMFGANSVKAQDSLTQAKDRKLKIIKKPVPFPEGNCSDNQGLVAVRATFDKSGKVTDVKMVRQCACSFFNEQVLKKARQIKFEPQVENGEPVTITKIIEYKYTKR